MLADIDNDSNIDLITGGWWNPIRIYLNNNGSFNTNPEYTSSTNSVVEAIFCGDVDKDAASNEYYIFISKGSKKLFILPFTNLQAIESVVVWPDTLPINEYCFDLENGWVSFQSVPDSGIEVAIDMVVSYDLDLGVTNWDSNIGNYLFINNLNPVSASSEEYLLDGFILHQNFPNPFNPTTKIKFTIPQTDSPLQGGARGGLVTLKVYDVLGNEIATLIDEYKPAGIYEVEFNGSEFSSGIYFYQLRAGDFVQSKKMILMK